MGKKRSSLNNFSVQAAYIIIRFSSFGYSAYNVERWAYNFERWAYNFERWAYNFERWAYNFERVQLFQLTKDFVETLLSSIKESKNTTL